MCMIDNADGYNEFNYVVRRSARKDHKCNECGRTILKLETYEYTSSLFDGEFSSSKMCCHCSVAAEWLKNNCGGYLTCGIIEDIEDHIDEYRGVAVCVPRLQRLKIGMKRRWTIMRGPNKGNLMPIPKLPVRLEPKHAHH